MLRDEVAKYTELSGNDGWNTPICVIGAYLDGYDKGLESSVLENMNKWIPVSERLPKAYQKVLVTYEEIHWANEPTTYDVKLISFGGVVDFIAWQPLPEPYKKGGE